MKVSILIASLFWIISCTEHTERSALEPVLINLARIDSIRANSDTGYSRIIGAEEFYSAEQWISKDGLTTTKILKDTIGRVSALVQFKGNVRIAYEEYYPEGQLKARLPLNSQGQYEGSATYYYPNGRIKSSGSYVNGFFNGSWKTFGSYLSWAAVIN